MKTVRILIALAATVAPSRASTIVTATPLDIGIPYRHTITMGGSDGASVIRHFGAWCWEDDELFNPANGEAPVGWTHTSEWVALTLTSATTLTLRLERQEGVAAPTAENPANIAGVNSMFPSFTIYGGWDQDGDQLHTFNNRGAIAWAEDVTYLDHLDNSSLTVAQRSWSLPAGNYSIILGSNAPATDTNRQGYLATLTTIPEPSGVALAALAAIRLVRRRRN